MHTYSFRSRRLRLRASGRCGSSRTTEPVCQIAAPPWSDTIMHGAQVTGSLNSANTSVTTGCISRQTRSAFYGQARTTPTDRRKPAAQFMNLGLGPKPLLQVRGGSSTPTLARRRDSGRALQCPTVSYQTGRRTPLEGSFPPSPPTRGSSNSGWTGRINNVKYPTSRRIQGATATLMNSLASAEQS